MARKGGLASCYEVRLGCREGYEKPYCIAEQKKKEELQVKAGLLRERNQEDRETQE